MEFISNILLYIHIGFGIAALLSGTVSLISKKGRRLHIRSGKVFHISMWVVIITAIVLSIFKNSLFLLMVGIFSMFQNYFGVRAIKNKSLKPSTLDWIILIIANINAIFMLISGQPVLIAFGIISLILVITSGRTFFKIRNNQELPRLLWLNQHIGMMMGTYIATLTAFLAVNAPRLLKNYSLTSHIIVWLSPTIILLPLLFYWQRKYTSSKK